MALIMCPECNTEISDRAEKCIKCGFPMASYVPPVKCPECGGESPGGAVTCGKCGFPLKKSVDNGSESTSPPLNNGCIDVTNVAPDFDDLEVHDNMKKFSLWRGFVNGWKNYAKFNGRARRKELWGWYLFTNIGFIVLALIIATFAGEDFAGEDEEELTSVQIVAGVLVGVLVLAIFLPTLAVLVRRMHDTGRGGAWVVLGVIFAIMSVAAEAFTGIKYYKYFKLINIYNLGLIFYTIVEDSAPGENRYGPNPIGVNLNALQTESTININN